MGPLRIQLVTKPAITLLTLSEVKAHMNIADDVVNDDGLILGYLGSGIESCEKFTGRSLINRTYNLFLDGWPSDRNREPWWDGVRTGSISDLTRVKRHIDLPRPPARSVVHVKFYDDNDNETVWATTNYFVDSVSEPGRVVLRTGASTPNITRVANGLEIQYVAGYGPSQNDVPEDLRLGIMMMIAFNYEHRGECTESEALSGSGADARWQFYRMLSL